MMARIGSALTVLLVVMAGCGGTSPGPGPGAGDKTGDDSQLIGRTFLSTEVKNRTLVSGTRISLSFPEKGKIAAQAGCNHLFGTVSFEGDKLAASEMGGTDMGCEQSLHQQDEWVTKFLTGKPVWALSGDNLVLTGADKTEIKLSDRKVVDPDRKLVGPKWTVDSLLDGEAASSVPGGAQAYLIFADGDKVSGNTGCNTLTGTAKAGPEKITFEQIATTKKACLGDAGMLEEWVLEVLKGEVTMRIDTDRLVLGQPSGKGLQLRAGY